MPLFMTWFGPATKLFCWLFTDFLQINSS